MDLTFEVKDNPFCAGFQLTFNFTLWNISLSTEKDERVLN